MSIPDGLIYSYFELTTDITLEQLAELKAKLEDKTFNPMILKKELGETLASMYHSKDAARNAREEFERVFSKKELPDEVPEFDCRKLGARVWIVRLMTESKLANSSGEARRLIQGGGVYVDGQKISSENFELGVRDGMLLKVGKRKFLKLRC